MTDKVRYESLRWEHFREMTLRASDSRSLATLSPEQLRSAYMSGPAGALILESTGEVLLCTGVIPQWRGLGHGWIVASPNAFRYPKQVMGYMKRLLSFVLTSEFTRIQIYVDASWEAALRFARHLGFGYDTTFHAYGPNGESYVVMSIFREGFNP